MTECEPYQRWQWNDTTEAVCCNGVQWTDIPLSPTKLNYPSPFPPPPPPVTYQQQQWLTSAKTQGIRGEEDESAFASAR